MDNVGVHGDIQGDCEDLISKKQTVEVEEFTSRVLYMAMFGSRRSGRRVATPARRLNYSGFVIFTWISTAEISIAFNTLDTLVSYTTAVTATVISKN
jgi:hypothetical protein